MGYAFTVKKGYRVKVCKRYPWPCADLPERTMELWPSDVLTKSPDGTYMKHTGLGTFGHVLADDEVEPIEGDVNLQII